MEGLSHTSRLAGLYRYVRGVPLSGNLTAPAAIMATAASLLLASLGLIPHLFPLVAAGFYSVLLLNYRVGRFRPGLLNLRRLNGMLLLDSTLLAIGAALALSLPSPISEATLSAFAALAAALRFPVTRALSGKSLRQGLLISSAALVLQAAPLMFFSANLVLRLGLGLGYLLGASLSLLATTLLNKLYLIDGLKPMSLLSGMLAVFLDGRKEWLEELAETLNDEADVRVEILLFRERGASKPFLALIIPDFHPGPFRDFGSSALPYMMVEELRSRGVEAVVVRGLSSHTKNIISSKDCEMIAKAVAEAVENCGEGFEARAGAPERLSLGDAKATFIPVGDTRLLLLTLHPKGMEDIPPSIHDGAADEGLIPIDAHNSFSNGVKELDGARLRELSELVRKASMLKPRIFEGLRAGYGRAAVDEYGLEEGMGPLGVSALVVGSGEQLAALIVLDGNNALPEVRSRILERLKPLKLSAAEALTTDTHIVNGVKLGGRGYHPLGEVVPAELLAERAYQAASEAISKLKPVEVKRVHLNFKGVKVMSDEFLAEASEKTYRCFHLFVIALAASPIASAALTLLLA